MRTVIGMFFCLLWVSTASAQQVDIEGTVRLEGLQTSIGSAAGGYQTFGSNVEKTETDSASDDILVWLVDKNPETSYRDTENLQILDQQNKRFHPRLMAVRAGNRVRIKNSDPVYHNVFSLSPAKRFDVGRRSPRDYQDVTFDKAGVVDVFCDIHSNMHAVIRVLPRQTIAWQKLESDGTFLFRDIPEGEYTLHLLALGNRKEKLNVKAVAAKKIILDTISLGAGL